MSELNINKDPTLLALVSADNSVEFQRVIELVKKGGTVIFTLDGEPQAFVSHFSLVDAVSGYINTQQTLPFTEETTTTKP